MIVEQLPLAGAFLLHPEPAVDVRGDFTRIQCAQEFAQAGLQHDFPQYSISRNTRRGTLRGLHYQNPPLAETKLVRCVRGSIFDVVVDLRNGSATRGAWYGVELSADNALALYIPAGFAHGFITLEDHSDVLYGITPPYQPGQGCALRWDDPDLAINWPLQPVLMSDADRQASLFATL